VDNFSKYFKNPWFVEISVFFWDFFLSSWKRRGKFPGRGRGRKIPSIGCIEAAVEGEENSKKR
jgi:hypothetical protein